MKKRSTERCPQAGGQHTARVGWGVRVHLRRDQMFERSCPLGFDRVTGLGGRAVARDPVPRMTGCDTRARSGVNFLCPHPALKRHRQLEGGCAASAVGRCRNLSSRCLARSRHRLTRQRGGINDRYRGGCSHPAWQAVATPSKRGRTLAARSAELTLQSVLPDCQGRSMSR